MNEWITYWHLGIASIVEWMLLIGAYFAITNMRIGKRFGYFLVAAFLMALCLFSPLHILAMNYLFSAHMIAHVIILLLVGPLLVLSIPDESKQKFIKVSKFISKHFLWCWFIGVGMMWIWHIPYIFDHAMKEGLHPVENISLLLSGCIFSWPLLGPNKEYRIPSLQGVVYLFTACMGCSLLGIFITFAPLDTYHYYQTLSVNVNFKSMITDEWGITPEVDQQMAGLIMWVPCCFIYLSGCIYLLWRWFNEKETDGELTGAEYYHTLKNKISI